MIAYLPLLLSGLALTIAAWIISGICSLIIGTFCGIVSCNRLSNTYIMRCMRIYTFIAKSIPAYVLILIAYFILPSLLNINISAFAAACAALAFSSSGYVTEIIRSGVNAIPLGQWDACATLGYPIPATLYRIIMPQTMRTIGPALFGEGEQLLKSTSLLATIGVTELTRSGMNIISRELNPLPIYLCVAITYMCCSGILTCIALYTERKLSYGQRY